MKKQAPPQRGRPAASPPARRPVQQPARTQAPPAPPVRRRAPDPVEEEVRPVRGRDPGLSPVAAMFDLGDSDQVAAAVAAASGEGGGGGLIKIPDTKYPWYILDTHAAMASAHWVPSQDGRERNDRVVCGATPATWDPKKCPICRYMLDLYEQAKKQGKAGKSIKDYANSIRAQFTAKFIVVRGTSYTDVVTIPGKGKKRVLKASFDPVSEEELKEGIEAPRVGILALSGPQFQKLVALCPQGENGPNLSWLTTRVLWSHRQDAQNKGGRKFKEVHWSAEARPSPRPKVEFDPKDFNVGADMDVDPEALQAAYLGLIEGADESEAETEDSSGVGYEGTEEEAPTEEVDTEPQSPSMRRTGRRGPEVLPDDEAVAAQEGDDIEPYVEPGADGVEDASDEAGEEGEPAVDDFVDDDPEEDMRRAQAAKATAPKGRKPTPVAPNPGSRPMRRR